MSGKYAGSEVLMMAVELEKKGYAFYESVVRAVKDKKARDVFQFLADEEVLHEKFFRTILKDVETKADVNPYDDIEMIHYFHSLIDRKIFPSEEEGAAMRKEIGDPAVAIRIALSLEKDAVLFFNELLNVTQKKDHDVINRIIDEERDHIRRILQLKDELKV
jgi:rubrerythrin